MLLKNKKRTKVLFFLFLFCSFFALAFTFTNTASAYTSEDMPEGYRPITDSDIGKVFGVDLDPIVYFDTSYTSAPNSYAQLWFKVDSDSASLSLRVNSPYAGDDAYVIDFSNHSTSVVTEIRSSSSIWVIDSFSFSEGDYIRQLDSGDYISSFSFLYVKDIERLTLIESILALFSNLVIWIPSVLTGLILMFYSAETGLTFLGALAVAGLGISVIFLLIGIIQNFLHFRG